MINIARQQALWRWDRVPLNLREQLGSDINSDFVWRTCQDQHVPEEKVYTIAKLTGHVFLGFIHPEDLGREIQEATGLSAPIASAIGDAINRRIFVPVRGELDTIYNPKPDDGPLLDQEIEDEGGVGPKIFEEIIPPRPMPKAAAPSPAAAVPGAPKAPSAPIVPDVTPAKTVPTASMPKPISISAPSMSPKTTPPSPSLPVQPSRDASAFAPGWSRPSSLGNVVSRSSFSPIATPRPQPTPPPQAQSITVMAKSSKPAAQRPPAPPVPPRPPMKSEPIVFPPVQKPPIAQTPSFAMAQDRPAPILRDIPAANNIPAWARPPQEVPLSFSKMEIGKPAQPSIVPPAQSKPTSPLSSTSSGPLLTPSPLRKDEGPAIIHEEPMTPPPRPSGFNINPRTVNFSDMTFPPKNLPPKPATIEFGKRDTEPSKIFIPQTPAPAPVAPKVVHYKEEAVPPPRPNN